MPKLKYRCINIDRNQIWIAVLMLAYMCTIFAEAFIIPNKYGDDDTLNTAFYTKLFQHSTDRSPNTGDVSVSFRTKAVQKHIHIVKHFLLEKMPAMIPAVAKPYVSAVTLPRPLYYYNNHFVSSFLYVCAGRAPPVLS